ncbi:MAG: tyrosine-type recombinase/integrase, partial [Fidelibacterota bacterium]
LDRKLKDNLAKPRLFMQALLAEAEPPRPKATLHSFRATFNNTLRDLGLSIQDRQILLAHSSSETTKIYTHPNFDLASKFVNQIPEYSNCNQNVTKS